MKKPINKGGLGFNEKLSLYKYSLKLVKKFIIRNLAGKYDGKRIHNWVLWRKLRDNLKAVLTGLQAGMSNLKELDGNVCNASENLAGKVLSKELVLRGINV